MLSEDNAIFVTSTSGNLSLNNSGDTVRIVDENNVVIETVSYIDQDTIGSINRNPDLSRSNLSKHSTISGNENNLFSPGKKSNGESF